MNYFTLHTSEKKFFQVFVVINFIEKRGFALKSIFSTGKDKGIICQETHFNN